MKILLVEDDANLREVTQRSLEKERYVVDEETKWIVEKIFELAYHGSGAASIAHRLIEEKVPTSGWLNYTRYGTFAHIYADAPEEKQYDWSIGQVKEILKDEPYIGNSIHNKQTNISFKNKNTAGTLCKQRGIRKAEVCICS